MTNCRQVCRQIRSLTAHAAAAFLLSSGIASATPVLWAMDYTNRNGTIGADQWSGSFTYDADTNVFSAINISRVFRLTDGTTLSSATYTLTDPLGLNLARPDGPNTARHFLLWDSVEPDRTGAHYAEFLLFGPGQGLTNAGGVVSLNQVDFSLVFAVTCGNAGCTSGSGTPVSSDATGSLVGTPVVVSDVPEPAPLALLGVAALAAMRRRRK